MIENVNDPKFDEIAAAKKAGHKFMKIYLHPSKVGRGQQEISVGGSIDLRIFRDGSGGGGPTDVTYTFVPTKDQNMVFKYDRNEQEYVCWLYDDMGKGYFSSVGYNRDLLATHWTENYFVIQDPTLHAEIKHRYESLLANPHKRDKQGYDPVGKANPDDSIKELESEILFLEGRRNQLEKLKVEKALKDKEFDDEYNKLKDSEKSKKGPGRPAKKIEETVEA